MVSLSYFQEMIERFVVFSKLKQYFPILMWGFGALAFMTQYACRVAPSGLITQINDAFNIGYAASGSINSFFLVAYVMMQLIVGRIVDRYQPHKVLITTTFVFFAANQLFSEAIHIHELIIARFIMGLTGAFAFVTTMKLAIIWYENRFLGVFSGMTQVSGMLGTVLGYQLVDYLLIGDNWRPVLKVLSLLLGTLVLLMIIFMRDKPGYSEKRKDDVSLLSGLKSVWSNPQSWFNALFAGLIYLPTATFGEYWGIQYLTDTNILIDKHQAVTAVSMIFIGFSVGGVMLGALSDFYKKRKPMMLVTPCCCLAVILPVLYWHAMPVWMLYTAMILYGFFNSGLILSYAVSGEINPENVSGVSIAFCNMLSVLLGTIAMPLFGLILEEVTSIPGMSSIEAFEYAAVLFPVALALAFFVALGIHETHCKKFQDA